MCMYISMFVPGTISERKCFFFFSAGECGMWFPNYTPPAHLTGEFPADRGFDPAGVAADLKVCARMRVSEVFHGRLAMLGVVGCVLPEILGRGAWFDIASQTNA